jgi:protein TonB
MLRVLVKPDGRAGPVQIHSSSGHPLLDESASTTVRSWHFNPATVDGKPVEEWYLVPIPFKLNN